MASGRKRGWWLRQRVLVDGGYGEEEKERLCDLQPEATATCWMKHFETFALTRLKHLETLMLSPFLCTSQLCVKCILCRFHGQVIVFTPVMLKENTAEVSPIRAKISPSTVGTWQFTPIPLAGTVAKADGF